MADATAQLEDPRGGEETLEVNGHWIEGKGNGEGPEPAEEQEQEQEPEQEQEQGQEPEEGKNLDEGLISEMFHELLSRGEIEQMISEQLASSKFQPLTDLLTLQQRFGTNGGSLAQVVPICDIHGTDCLSYTKGEKLFRCKLASFYRLLDLFGWAATYDGNVTASFTEDSAHLMVIPYGLLFSEVTASSLVKLDVQCSVVDSGSSSLDVDIDGFKLDWAIHGARTDVKFIAHLTSPAAISVSVMKSGLLPLCPEAMLVGEVPCFEFDESIYNEEEYPRLVNTLGSTSKVLILRNYGILVCAESIEEAYGLSANVMAAVETQLSLAALGVSNLRVPSAELCARVCEAERQSMTGSTNGAPAWRAGEREFEAMMRQLDAAGYSTGYVYRDIKSSRSADCSLSDSGLSADGLPHQGHMTRAAGGDPTANMSASEKAVYKANKMLDYRGVSPNPFHRADEPLSGRSTPNPKIARWLSDSPTPAKLAQPAPPRPDSANQFAPRSINPIELREKVKEIRKDYYTDKVTAGPQSRILDGITWDEARVIKAPDGHVSGTGDSVVISASKGIIQREHQHAVVGCKKFDPPNPFNQMCDSDVERYRQELDGAGRANDSEPCEADLVPGPDGLLVSSAERLQRVRMEQGDTGRAVDTVTKQVHPERHCGESFLVELVDDVTERHKFFTGEIMVDKSHKVETLEFRKN